MVDENALGIKQMTPKQTSELLASVIHQLELVLEIVVDLEDKNLVIKVRRGKAIISVQLI